MKPVRLALSLFAAAVLAAPLTGSSVSAQSNEQFIPSFSYRTGPFAPNGIPFADGFIDYLKMVNARDGGINGVRISFEECETAYNTDRGVECYERLKSRGITAVVPLSTGITYALIPRTRADRIPMLTSGYGRSDASDGRVFPWVFTMPATYWAQADAIIQYIAQREGGVQNLRGKKIAFVFHDSAFGREPIPMLEVLAREYGFEITQFPVTPPGAEQRSIWLRIGRQLRPDWTIMWGWGIMNPTAIQEAAAVGFPRDRFIGVWWSGSEQDVVPVGDQARGYLAGNFHAPGTDFQVIRDIQRLVVQPGQATGDGRNVGTVLYNRGVVNAAIVVEAVRTAQARFGNRVMNGEQVRWGFENLNLTPERLQQMGFAEFMPPLRMSCLDHEGGGQLRIQQWNGQRWTWASEWITPNQQRIRPLYESSAAAFARENNITPRNCDTPDVL